MIVYHPFFNNAISFCNNFVTFFDTFFGTFSDCLYQLHFCIDASRLEKVAVFQKIFSQFLSIFFRQGHAPVTVFYFTGCTSLPQGQHSGKRGNIFLQTHVPRKRFPIGFEKYKSSSHKRLVWFSCIIRRHTADDTGTHISNKKDPPYPIAKGKRLYQYYL